MLVQCRVCKRVRDNGKYRLPAPEELDADISETYCPRCAHETLAQIQRGEFVALSAVGAAPRVARSVIALGAVGG